MPRTTRAGQILTQILLGMAFISMTACEAPRHFDSESQFSSKAEVAYCATTVPIQGPSRILQGEAHYELRSDGNGLPTDSAFRWTPSSDWHPHLSVALDFQSESGDSLRLRVPAPTEGWQKPIDALAALATQFPSNWDVYKAGSHIFSAPPIGEDWRLIHHSGVAPPIRNPDPRPIRLAEIAVVGANGQTLQCGTTDEVGGFALEIPLDAQAWRLEVRARAHHHRNSTSILDAPESNRTYALIADASQATGPLRLRAKVRGDLLGGAFHMLELTLRAQDFLRRETRLQNHLHGPLEAQSCDPSWPVCQPFDRAPRAQIYWRPGRSPNESPQSTSSASYYVRGSASIYISGGLRGNTISSDMDHFDDAVVLHEYAHFLEDFFGHSASPGGAHDGDSLIDPRLAWSEGFANFLQAAITGRSDYRDSYGTPECSSLCAGVLIHESFDHPERDLPDPEAKGEGIFREFAVTRFLHSAFKQSGFGEIWLSFQSRHLPQHQREAFPTFASFIKRHDSRAGSADWATHLSREVLLHGEGEYATLLQQSPHCSTTPMYPRRMPWDWGDWSSLDWSMNNDFFQIHHPGGRVQVELHYAHEPLIDAQLYLWSPTHRMGVDRFLMATSHTEAQSCDTNSSCLLSDAETPGLDRKLRHLNASIPAGTYLLQLRLDVRRMPIRVKPELQASMLYQLKINGERQCPTK
ncbi:MAG TPA: hypothetical protein PLZ57_12580 [Pseudobdellovibrionaceae bacterium]|nr:hypothetical protein [Pseudobdellovibrionaceae bacterium]